MKKALVASAVVALLALGCGEEEGVTPRAPDRFEPTTPVNVLKNVEISFNRRDAGLIKTTLTGDFLFFFDPYDIGQNPPGSQYVIPSSWSNKELLRAVGNMCARAYSINLSISTGNVGEPEPRENQYWAGNINLSLLVMVDELNGFIADKGYCNFLFEGYDPPSGKEYWHLGAWWDSSGERCDEYPGVTPTSLGKILAMFY